MPICMQSLRRFFTQHTVPKCKIPSNVMKFFLNAPKLSISPTCFPKDTHLQNAQYHQHRQHGTQTTSLRYRDAP